MQLRKDIKITMTWRGNAVSKYDQLPHSRSVVVDRHVNWMRVRYLACTLFNIMIERVHYRALRGRMYGG